ncbi:MAG: hypothetical protein LBG57_02815 [Treponema sp.]|jgi:hypothetical protein|nr:hypothetical protein [Treponema sp.]
MGYGLGANSPIILSLGKNNFEALVNRHGQHVRWRIAKKCPCVTENNRPDLHCQKCGGTGDIYDYQREYNDVFRATVRDNIISVPEELSDATILEVYNAYGQQYQFCRCGDFIQITGLAIPDNQLVDVRVCVPIVKRIENVALEKVGGGYYRVPGILTPPSKLEGVFYQAAGDVIAAEGLKDSDDNQVNALGFRRDTVLTDSETETITAGSVDYVMPVKFIVLSQNLSKEDQALVNAHTGDAVCTYPYMYNLSVNDVLTVLSGTMTHKIVFEKREDNLDDTIPEFFVAKVDSIETKAASFKEGEDFILIGTNKLHWIGNQPGAGDMMSIIYRYHPTYRVAKNIPMLRTSEDQRMPRKVILELYAAFGEAKRVNQNG